MMIENVCSIIVALVTVLEYISNIAKNKKKK